MVSHPAPLALVLALLSLAAANCPQGTHPLENGPPGICLPGPEACPAGTTPSFTVLAPVQAVTNCRACAPGFTTFQNDVRVCRRIGFACPAGHRETSSGDCWRCNADEWFDRQSERCVSCPPLQGAAAGLSLWCAPCSKIVEHGVTQSRCMTQDVFAPHGGNCPMGSRVVYRDSLNVPLCQKCAPGSFSASVNAQQCTRCSEFTAVSHEGAHRCLECPRGTTANGPRTACVNADTGCEMDQEPAEVNGYTICRSTRCADGGDPYNLIMGRVCGPCSSRGPSAEFLAEDGCRSCPLTSLSDGLQCVPCPRGEVRMEDGSCGCSGPLALTRGVNESGDCVRCPSGSYGVPGPNGQNVCAMCRAGTQYFSLTDSQLFSCLMDPRCLPPTDLCIPCRQGTVSTELGSVTCEACPNGTFSYGSGSPRCLSEGEPTPHVSFNDPFGNTFHV